MPPICVDLEPNVPVPCGTWSVSPWTTVDLLEREAEPLGGDHGERRLVSLAVRERAGADDRLAVGGDLDLAVLLLGATRS